VHSPICFLGMHRDSLTLSYHVMHVKKHSKPTDSESRHDFMPAETGWGYLGCHYDEASAVYAKWT
jgi:hypothetical protein